MKYLILTALILLLLSCDEENNSQPEKELIAYTAQDFKNDANWEEVTILERLKIISPFLKKDTLNMFVSKDNYFETNPFSKLDENDSTIISNINFEDFNLFFIGLKFRNLDPKNETNRKLYYNSKNKTYFLLIDNSADDNLHPTREFYLIEKQFYNDLNFKVINRVAE